VINPASRIWWHGVLHYKVAFAATICACRHVYSPSAKCYPIFGSVPGSGSLSHPR
jgi:hypothetical protein